MECARGRTARRCHQGLQGACGEFALPYRTVARWVKAFNEERQNVNVADMRRPGRHTQGVATQRYWRTTRPPNDVTKE
jgi:hypothetical protein